MDARIQGMTRCSISPFDCRAPLSTSPSAYRPQPGWCPTSSFAFSRGVTLRWLTKSPSLWSTRMASFPYSTPSSSLWEANTKRVQEISCRWKGRYRTTSSWIWSSWPSLTLHWTRCYKWQTGWISRFMSPCSPPSTPRTLTPPTTNSRPWRMRGRASCAPTRSPQFWQTPCRPSWRSAQAASPPPSPKLRSGPMTW